MDHYIITVQSISKEYFMYLVSKNASFHTDRFSEPVKIFSNVSGGSGILGSYTSSKAMDVWVK